MFNGFRIQSDFIKLKAPARWAAPDFVIEFYVIRQFVQFVQFNGIQFVCIIQYKIEFCCVDL